MEREAGLMEARGIPAIWVGLRPVGEVELVPPKPPPATATVPLTILAQQLQHLAQSHIA